MQPLVMVKYTNEVSKSRFTWFIYRNTSESIKTTHIWLPCTKYVVSAGLLWYIS